MAHNRAAVVRLTPCDDCKGNDSTTCCDASCVWLPGILERVARFLPPNHVAASLRLVDRATAAQFRNRALLRLSQPVPSHAFVAHWSAAGACRPLTLKQRLQLVCLTASSGDLANLGVAVAAAGLVLPMEAMAAAAGSGHLHTCRWLLDRGCPLSQGSATAFAAAAGGGQRQACEWLLAHGAAWTAGAVLAAAGGGHEDLAAALIEAKPARSVLTSEGSLFAAAAAGCGLAALQRQAEQAGGVGRLREWDQADAVIAAAGSRTPDWPAKVEWLLAEGCPATERAIACAATRPDAVARLAWLSDHGFRLRPVAIEWVASHGNTAAVQWLLGRGLEPDGGAAVAAAAAGCVPALQSLAAAGCPVDPAEALEAAAEGGHLAVAAWLEEAYGVEALGLGSGALAAAGGSGSVALLRWLHERGCRWEDAEDETAWVEAAVSGCQAALEWLAEAGVPLPASGQPYVRAARNGDLATLRSLHALGVPLGDDSGFVMADSIHSIDLGRDAPLPALQLLLDMACPVRWASAAWAAEQRTGDREAAVEWVAQQRRQRGEALE